jgi:alkanesulfonate monooxygenase SsuD/methylene tetrahydromethanopterin reductase-like flavin-dependent oxidoreductase (luciferase family)
VEVTSVQRLLLAPTLGGAKAKLNGRTGYASLTGAPTDVVGAINAFQDAGVHTLFVMVPNNDQETLDLFEREVMPGFKAG